MIDEIIKDMLEFISISPFEESLIIKLKYNFKLSELDKTYLWVLNQKLFCLKMLRGVKC